MGVTIHYRGSLDELSRVEDFEDRVLDLVLDLGGTARIWRTAADDNPSRIVRGLIVNLFPGQESTSLLISPEGWIVNLFSIEDAELGKLDEPPWCFVKTQFGPVEGHVALVELLAAIKKEFITNLEVSDEGGYWETRDFDALSRNFKFLQAAIDGLADGLRQFGLSAEAAEDPSILLTRIERIAQIVQRNLSRPSEHAPVHFGPGDDAAAVDDDPPGTEAQWDASFKENRRRQERMQREIEERIAAGETLEAALEHSLPDPHAADPDEDADDDGDDFADKAWSDTDPFMDDESDDDDDETARGALDDDEFEDEDDEVENDDEVEDEDDEEVENDESVDAGSLPDAESDGAQPPRRPRGLLVRRAMDLMLGLRRFEPKLTDQTQSQFDVLLQGAGDMMGGLAQAGGRQDRATLGLSIVQLKRALRGAAFARGALYPLRAAGTLAESQFKDLSRSLDGLAKDITAKLAKLRDRLESENSSTDETGS